MNNEEEFESEDEDIRTSWPAEWLERESLGGSTQEELDN